MARLVPHLLLLAAGCAAPADTAQAADRVAADLGAADLVAAPAAAQQATPAPEAGPARFTAEDVFELEWADDPQLAPDGSRVVYVRRFFDRTTDRARANLWTVAIDGSDHRPLLTGLASYSSPRWSPDGGRLAYLAQDEAGRTQLFVRWMDTGQTAMVTRLDRAPGGLSWSPDGTRIAFSMFVPDKRAPFAPGLAPPDGADWAEQPRTYEDVWYRADGRGFLKDGFHHVFVVPADGGSPRQLSSGPYHHRGTPAWTPDGGSLILSANRREDWQRERSDSEIWELRVADGRLRQLTDRRGPDHSPAVSPDGAWIAWAGHDDTGRAHETTRLSVMRRDGTEARVLTADFDFDVAQPTWGTQPDQITFRYDREGDRRIAQIGLDGAVADLTGGVGGTSLGRPYTSGDFSLARGKTIVFTHGTAARPADVARLRDGGPQRLTHLNEDLLGNRALGDVEEIWYESAHDQRRIHGWILTPPGFDPEQQYPLILEIHGGPATAYGPWFAAELQLYAAAGYVVLYVNPRGSTSYGHEFADLIHHAYPGNDYDDLMSGVDAVLERGFVDPEQLFVTGGSGGGLLTAWIVTQTDRFAAAVSAKPVINWYSFALTSDVGAGFLERYFPGMPWEAPEAYLERSPIHHVGQVTTPTMLLTGEVDWRTPMSESEQFYQALHAVEVPTALVRVPGASHGIAARPSHLAAKAAHVLAWFARYRED